MADLLPRPPDEKRPLTPGEIDLVCEGVFRRDLRDGHPGLDDTVFANNDHRLRQSLRSLVLYPMALPTLTAHLRWHWLRARIQGGERVGISASQGIGQVVTQLVLNTFHLSGVLNVSSVGGVGRLEELLAITKKPKGATMSAEMCTADAVRPDDFVYRTLGDFVESWKLVPTGPFQSWVPWMRAWWRAFGPRKFVGRDPDPDSDSDPGGPGISTGLEPWTVRLRLSRTRMFKHQLAAWDLVGRLRTRHYPLVRVMASPDQTAEIHIALAADLRPTWRSSVSFANLVSAADARNAACAAAAPVREVPSSSSSSSSSTLALRAPAHSTQDRELETFLRQVLVPALLDLGVGGIPGVANARAAVRGGALVCMEPSHFRALIGDPHIRFETARTTDIWQAFHVLGIEAARELLVQEIVGVLETGGGGLVDRRHVMLLADAMTMHGTPRSVSRYGIDRADVGPLAKASFEQMLDNFMQAAYRGEHDPLTGVSGAIITGKADTFGTSSVELRVSPGQREALENPPRPFEYTTLGPHALFQSRGLADRVVER